jgi:hypothetical protein
VERFSLQTVSLKNNEGVDAVQNNNRVYFHLNFISSSWNGFESNLINSEVM